MQYRLLGNSGLKVSEICFGVMSFTGQNGWSHIARTSQAEANEMVAVALAEGVNFFDTADTYSAGVSEIMLGKALKKRRTEAIIATKCGFRMGTGPNDDGLSRRHILSACEASLKRLGTDYIDLYQIHSYDFRTPLEESLSTFDQLVKDGKVRYIGVSNFTGWQLMKAISICRENKWEKIVSLQAYYSLLGRDLELELVPVCLDQGVGILTWSPLHGGILTGKYHQVKRWPKNTRLKSNADHLPYNEEKGKAILDELFSIARKHKVSVAQVSLNYLLRKPGVTSLVIGARTKEQLLDNLKTSNWALSEEEVKKLDSLSEPPRIYPFWYFDIFRKERYRP